MNKIVLLFLISVLYSCSKTMVSVLEYKCTHIYNQSSQGNTITNIDSNYFLTLEILKDDENEILRIQQSEFDSLTFNIVNSRFERPNNTPTNILRGEFFKNRDSLYTAKYQKTSGVSYTSRENFCRRLK